MGMPVEKLSDAPSILDLREAIEEELRQIFSVMRPSALKDAFEYTTFPAGKRIRPVLALSLCYDLGGEWPRMLRAATSLEMIHNSSLIHDDLPELDNDDMRRGRPSCHKQFGHGTALLAGDFIIAFALRNLLSADLLFEQQLEMSRALTSAFEELCLGQQLDISSPSAGGDLLAVHELKTGALFGCCAEFAAIGAPQFFTGQRRLLNDAATCFGRTLGVCFQICNDYQDVFGAQSETGRVSSSDIKNGKHTSFTSPGAARQQFDKFAELAGQLERSLSQLEAFFPAQNRGAASLTRRTIEGVTGDFRLMLEKLQATDSNSEAAQKR